MSKPEERERLELLPGHDDYNDGTTSAHDVYESIQVEYAAMAPWYDRFWHSYTEGTLKRPLHEALLELEGAANERNNGRDDIVGRRSGFALVDVGCGTGTFLKRLRDSLLRDGRRGYNGVDASYQLTGIEPSEEMLDVARKKFDDDNHEEDAEDWWTKDGNCSECTVNLKRSSAERLPLEDESANVIVSTNAFHFFRDRRRALDEMRRVLHRDGLLVMTDWCDDYWIVKLYHLLERLHYKNWGFGDRYPSPLTGAEMAGMVRDAGFEEVAHDTYRVRVFSVFFWGMQTVRARRNDTLRIANR